MFSGDIRAFGETQSGFATHGWNSILAMNVPTIASHGNHDCALDSGPDANCANRNTASFDTNVGYARVSSASWGPVNAFTQTGNDIGHYNDVGGSGATSCDPVGNGSNANYAIRFSVNGHKFLVIALEFGPRTSVMTWAHDLAAVYPDHNVIYVSHQYLMGNSSTASIDGTGTPRVCQAFDAFCSGASGYTSFCSTGQMMWDTMFKTATNSFLTLNGHWVATTGTKVWGHRTDAANDSHSVVQWFHNFQQMEQNGVKTGDGNDAVVRLLFHEQTRTFDIILMSSTTDTAYETYAGIAWPL